MNDIAKTKQFMFFFICYFTEMFYSSFFMTAYVTKENFLLKPSLYFFTGTKFLVFANRTDI